MTVNELIEKLKELKEIGDLDGSESVHAAYNYGDHWDTMVAKKIRKVRQDIVTHSSYHDMDRVVLPEDEAEHESNELKSVCLLE